MGWRWQGKETEAGVEADCPYEIQKIKAVRKNPAKVLNPSMVGKILPVYIRIRCQAATNGLQYHVT